MIFLLQADSTLESPTVSLLQLALRLRDPGQRDVIVPSIVDALVDRHSRLLQLGRAILPQGLLSTLEVSEFKLCTEAPNIIDALRRSSVSISQALELDDTNVYDNSDMHGNIRLSPQYAEKMWSAGFREIDRPNHTGLTPILQSWYVADFDMMSWYVNKGISARSQHQSGALCGLHLYAARIAYPGAYFSGNADLVNTDFAFISELQRDQNLHHDRCSCVCAPNGCTPASILVKSGLHTNGSKLDTLFPTWCKKTNPSATLLELSAREYTRAWLFAISQYPHTCCDTSPLGDRFGWPGRDNTDDETSMDAERVVSAWMKRYNRVRKEYDGPLEGFPRFFMEQVKSGSLASEPDFDDCRSKFSSAGGIC